MARYNGWNYKTFCDLVDLAEMGLLPTDSEIREIERYTNLLPPQRISPLTGSKLCAMVKLPENRATWGERREILDTLKLSKKKIWKDENILTIWPARTKMDLAIRRTRLRDSYEGYRKCHLEDEFWAICERLPGMDIITVVNILNANLLLSSSSWNWFKWWDKMHVFDSDASHFATVAKTVDELVKKFPSKGFDRWKILQNSVLTGYRNPPFPGFDVVEETRKLAEGGGRHGLDPATSSATFRHIALTTLTNVTPKVVPWINFKDFVTSGDWQTSGASSVGKVEWTAGEEKGHFKARKNLVPDVVDLDSLADECLKSTTQENRSITKSELGKLRMAVASDMHTYLKMSWITRMMGSAYLQWPGSTIEEDVNVQHDRMLDMLKTIAKTWNLPFDYASFDHQPNTDELISICEAIFQIARNNVPVEHSKEFEDIAENILSGFQHSTLSIISEGKEHVYKVKGGLMSGLRWTTIVGNGWNTVMTTWVYNVLKELGQTTDDIHRWIRGDDSAITTESYAKALLFRLGYEAVGAEGSDGKFGIHKGQSEFLRIWYDKDGCHGYPCRSIPGLSQRKPWSSAPWEEESTMMQIYESLKILKRRGCDLERCRNWWEGVKLVWSQHNHVSSDWLMIPKSLGGVGAEPWDGETLAIGKWPKVDRASVVVTNMTTWRSQKLKEDYSTWFNITDSEASELSSVALSEKLCADDIPSINRVLRDKVGDKPAFIPDKRKIQWPAAAATTLMSEMKVLAGMTPKYGILKQHESRYLPGMRGKWSKLAQRWNDAGKVCRIRNIPTFKTLAPMFPELARDVKKLEHNGLTMNESLDWLFDTTSIGVTEYLHPALTGTLRLSVLNVAQGFLLHKKLLPKQLTQIIHLATAILEPYLVSSKLSRVMYRW